jgi:hypothetical protein
VPSLSRGHSISRSCIFHPEDFVCYRMLLPGALAANAATILGFGSMQSRGTVTIHYVPCRARAIEPC